jgi:hypothetical protein
MIISDCLAVPYLMMTVFTFGVRKMWHEELLAPSASSSVPSDGEESFTYIYTDTCSFTDPSSTQVGLNVELVT